MSFCTHYNFRYVDPDPSTLCMYAEFLARSFSSPRAIRNYISGVRIFHKYLSIECAALQSFELDLILRALDLTMDHIPNQRIPLDQHMLNCICEVCDTLPDIGHVLKVAFLFGFYGFLRQSNLAPRTAQSFDPRRHTCRGDIMIRPPGLVILIKWSKTLQRGENAHLIPLPKIPGSPLCPNQAYIDMLSVCPTLSPNDPLLRIPRKDGHLSVLTSGKLAQAFKAIITPFGYSPKSFSLHSLRAGGASTCFAAGVDYVHIKRHGTWRSDSFWSYIVTHSIENSPVATALASSPPSTQ